MKYMGNKQRIVNDILPLMLDDKYTTFVDLFCGSCSVIQKVPLTYHRIANDKNKYLIEMWKSIVEDKEFPLEIPKNLYSNVRDCWHGRNNRYEDDYIGWIGFMASFNGRFFDGGYSGHHVKGKNGKERDYITEQIKNTLAQKDELKTVDFYSGCYDELTIPNNSIIYCDIPYFGTKQYDTSKGFDYDKFYDWCRKMNATGKYKIFISEYTMPSDFRCIWQKEITNAMNPTITKKPIEKLFTLD